MKILIADNVSERAVKVLQAEPSWEVVFLPGRPGASVAEEIRDADALLVRSATKATAALLEQATRLRVIGRAGTGVDNVDLEAATKKGIVVMNTPGGNAVSVAEHTLGLLLALARHIPAADSLLKQGKWEKKKLTGIELRSKTLGLVGFGNIGREVARLAQTFGMTILASDPFVSSRLAEDQGVRLVALEELLKESDFLSLHAAATAENRHLINARTLALTKPGVRIVNCARGELIQEADLLAALESGQVGGAGLDVFETEPPKDSRLASHPLVVATPHIAGSTEDAQEIVGIRIAEQVRDYLLLGVPRNAVNMPTISPEEYQKLSPYLQLGESLGAFLSQIAGERIGEVRISYDGGLAELNTHLVKNAVLKGILKKALSDHVNIVNAGVLAQARGLEVLEVRSVRRAAFSHSLGLAVHTETGSTSALAMVGRMGHLRVLGINELDIEAPLQGIHIYTRNRDVPGVIGRIGSILGDHKINIANFALGREIEGGEAIALIQIDERAPEDVLAEIRAIPAIRFAHLIEI
jgi:D-3-phosphoglycerate dehydrogenase